MKFPTTLTYALRDAGLEIGANLLLGRCLDASLCLTAAVSTPEIFGTQKKTNAIDKCQKFYDSCCGVVKNCQYGSQDIAK